MVWDWDPRGYKAVIAELDRDVDDYYKDSAGTYYYYGGWGNVAIRKDENTVPGYVSYTHGIYNSNWFRYYFYDIHHKGKRQKKLPTGNNLDKITNIYVYYKSGDSVRETPILLYVDKYYKNDGDNNWSVHRDQGLILDVLDNINCEKYKEVIIRLEKRDKYGGVSNITSESYESVYTKKIYTIKESTTVSSVYNNSIKLFDINVESPTSVNVYYENSKNTPLLIEFIGQGSDKTYYKSEGKTWSKHESLDKGSLDNLLSELKYKVSGITLSIDCKTHSNISVVIENNPVLISTTLTGYTRYKHSATRSFSVSTVKYKDSSLTFSPQITKTTYKCLYVYYSNNDEKLEMPLLIQLDKDPTGTIYYINTSSDDKNLFWEEDSIDNLGISGTLSSVTSKLQGLVVLDISKTDQNYKIRKNISTSMDTSTYSGYTKYTHKPEATPFMISSILYKAKRISGIVTTKKYSELSVFYNSTHKIKPLLIELNESPRRIQYFENSGNNILWNSWALREQLKNKLGTLNAELNSVIISINQISPYSDNNIGITVTPTQNTDGTCGYIKYMHCVTRSPFRLKEVRYGGSKIGAVKSPLDNVNEVSVYFSNDLQKPLLFYTLAKGTYKYYSATSTKGSEWAEDSGSGLIAGDNLKAKLYSVTYRLKNALVLDPVTTNIGDINVSKGTVNPGQYAKYEYSKSEPTFNISSLLYKCMKLSIDISDKTEVKKIVTYFTENSDKLLAIYISTKDKHMYYTNPNIDSQITSFTYFDGFVVKNKEVLSDMDLNTVLQNIHEKKCLEYFTISKDLRGKLWRFNDVLFDLKHQPKDPDRTDKNTNPDTSYKSDVTDMNVVVAQEKLKDVSEFVMVNHYPGNFTIQGIKFSGESRMEISGDLPDVLLSAFNLYCEKDGKTCGNPLLIILTSRVDTGYIPEYYYISKNVSSGKWDLFKTAGLQVGTMEIKTIVANIKQHQALTVSGLSEPLKSKFTDLTKDLTIDLAMAKAKINVGKYTSEKREIPYTRYSGTPYNYVRHASRFPSFTVSKIKTPFGEISGSILPSKDHLLVRLNAYYKGSKAEDIPLLVGLKELSRDTYIYYVPSPLKKDKWERSTDITGSNIKEKLQESLKLFENDQRAKPENVTNGKGSFHLNLLKQIDYKDFNLTVSEDENNGFYKCVHKPIKEEKFTLKSVNCGTKALAGFNDGSVEYSEAVVYFKGVNYENAVLIEAVCKYKTVSGFPKTVYYYSKDSNNTWKSYKLSTIVEFKEYTEDLGVTDSVITHIEQHGDKIDLGSLGALTEKLENKLVAIPVVGLPDGAGGGDQHASATDPWSYVWKVAVAGAGSGILGFGGWKAWKSLSTRCGWIGMRFKRVECTPCNRIQYTSQLNPDLPISGCGQAIVSGALVYTD